MMRGIRWPTAAAAVAAMASLPTPVAAQCALCKQALESSGQGGLIEGFYWSILMLMAMPACLIGGIGLILYRSWRAKQGVAAGAG